MLFIFIGIIALVLSMEVIFQLRYWISCPLAGCARPSGTYWKMVHVLFTCGILCILYGYLIEPRWLEITRIKVKTDKLQKTGLRIVHISDLHSGKYLRNETKLAELINPLQPDVIFFTGDCVISEKGLPHFRMALSSLKASLGKYAVAGNIDMFCFPYLDKFSETGFTELDDSIIRLDKNGESFCIYGSAHIDTTHTSDFNVMNKFPHLHELPENTFNIFLFHTPDMIKDMSVTNVDLYLCGHTHGGQVRLPWYGAMLTFSEYGKEFESGRYQVGKTTLYVTRGVGTEDQGAAGPRFLCRPEITVIDVVGSGLVMSWGQVLNLDILKFNLESM